MTTETIEDPKNPGTQIPNPDYVAPTVDTKTKTIVDPSDSEKQIPNPDYVAPAIPDELNLGNDEDYSTTIGETGNKTIDSISALLIDRKVDGADIIMKEFAETGELSISAQAKLIESLGEATANLILNQLSTEATQLKEKGKAARTEILEYAAEKFGADDVELTWKQIQDFTRDPTSGITDKDRDTMNSMLSAGGLSAKLAIDNIARIYYASEGTTSQAELLEGDTYSGATSFKPLGRAEYVQELTALVDAHGEDSSQVTALRRRRLQSMEKGIN